MILLNTLTRGEAFMQLHQLKSSLLSLIAEHPNNFSIAIQTDEGAIKINANSTRRSASVAKLFILAELYQQVQLESISLDRLVYIHKERMVEGSGVISYLTNSHVYSYKNLAQLMVIVSDNTASNVLLDTIGIQSINDFTKRIGCKNTYLERKFMDYQAQARGLENITTAEDVVRLLTLFSNENKYFSENNRMEILKMLGDQQFCHKLPSFQHEGQPVKFYHKTGELMGVEHDVAIIESNEKLIKAAVLTEGWVNNRDGQQYIAAIGKLLLDYVLT